MNHLMKKTLMVILYVLLSFSDMNRNVILQSGPIRRYFSQKNHSDRFRGETRYLMTPLLSGVDTV